jgi:hypothetical protein
VTGAEVGRIAAFLGITRRELRKKYLRRVGWRMSIIEEAATKDCIFLRVHNGIKNCAIYDVRPNQCRTWPFWKQNIESIEAWHAAATRCRGIDHGRQYSASEIRRIIESKKWWEDDN